MLHTRYINNKKHQENDNISNQNNHFQDIKYVQYKNANTYWDYWNFPWRPIDKERFEIIGRNTMISHYHYRLYPNLGKVVCAIFRIPCAFPAYVDQLDKYWLQNCALSSLPRYAYVKKDLYNKIFEHEMFWTLMEFLDNKKPHVKLDSINALILS